MTTVAIALIGMIQKAMIVSFKAREQMTCTRMTQTAFARLKNIDFYYLFAADSGSANYGLWAAYPYKGVLDGLKSTLAASKFDRFKIEVVFMRRDSGDSNGDGSANDLIRFTDNNSDSIDDYDSNVKYYDQNVDGDFYDTYASGVRTVAEQPDTHLKQVTLKVFRLNRMACAQTQLISLEQFSGDSNPSSEAVLKLLISTPSNNTVLYRSNTAALTNSRGLAIDKSYPSDIAPLRADAASALSVSGETDSLASVNLYVGASAILNVLSADFDGAFSGAASAVTGALVEGSNLLTGQAVKDSYTSPISARTLLYDYSPPGAYTWTPTGALADRTPGVQAFLLDLSASTTTTSGICPDVVTLKVNGAAVHHNFDPASGRVVWIDSGTGIVPILADGAYAVVLEGGDYAGYKATHSWTFTVSVPDTDNSEPTIANRSPEGLAGSQLPVISAKVFDNQSGIIPASITLKVNGSTVVDPGNIGEAYDPATGTVSYTPQTPFAHGQYVDVEICATHWATDPADKRTRCEGGSHTPGWGFTVP